MKCEQCQLELEELLDGDVSPVRAAEMRAHLADCQACREWLGALEREGEVFTRYYTQTALEPGPDMWLSVRDRMRRETASPGRAGTRVPLEEMAGQSILGRLADWVRRPVFLRQAAAAIGLVVLTAAVTTLLLSRRESLNPDIARGPQPHPTTAQPSPTPLSPGGLPVGLVEVPKKESPSDSSRVVASVPKPKPRAPSEEELLRAQVAKTEKVYVDTIRMLDRVISRRRQSIDPAVFSQYEASIALIDESIDKSRAAVRGRLSDPVAEQFLLAAYARKVELMQEIAIQ